MSEQIFTKEHGGTFAKRCRHFAGLDFSNHQKRCDAGVLMPSVIVERSYQYRYAAEGPRATVYTSKHSIPCFKDTDPLGVCQCSLQSFPTAEEIAADRDELDRLISRSLGARAAILQHAAGQRGVKGELPCPICNAGQLHYSIAQLNGHVWAKCSTADCVSFME